MKRNFYAMVLLSGTFLHASHGEDQNKYLTAPADLKSQVAAFIEQDDRKEQAKIQKIKDDRINLLLVSAQALSKDEILTRVDLKKVRNDLKALEQVGENEAVITELKTIKKNHKRAFFIGSSSVADNVLQEEKTSLKNVIKTTLLTELQVNNVTSENLKMSATQTDTTQEDQKINHFHPAPSAPIVEDSQR